MPGSALTSVQFQLVVPDVSSGDFDGDGDVDGADFQEWQRNFGSQVTEFSFSGADGNGNGVVDAADYVVWRHNFNSGENASSAGVPEPQAAMLVLVAFVALASGRPFAAKS
jgi:hypothetical protein